MHSLLLLLLGLLFFSCSSELPLPDPKFDEGGFGDKEVQFEAPVGQIIPEYFDRAYKGEHLILPVIFSKFK